MPRIGATAADPVGFHNKVATAQRAAAAQAVAVALTGTLTGTVNGALVDVAAAAGACAGTTSPTAGNVDTAIATAVATIVTGVNEQNKELMTTLNATITLVNELRLALVNKGLIKGAA